MNSITQIRENSTPHGMKRESHTHPYTEHGWEQAGMNPVTGHPIYHQAGCYLAETLAGWIVRYPFGRQYYYSECTLEQLTCDLLEVVNA